MKYKEKHKEKNNFKFITPYKHCLYLSIYFEILFYGKNFKIFSANAIQTCKGKLRCKKKDKELKIKFLINL